MKIKIPGLILLTMFLAFGLFPGCARHHDNPTAVKGFQDLSTWDFEKDGIVDLDGQWEFYWDRLSVPDDFSGGDPIESRAFFPCRGSGADFS